MAIDDIDLDEKYCWGSLDIGSHLVYKSISDLSQDNIVGVKKLTIDSVYVVKDLYLYLPIVIIEDDMGNEIDVNYSDFINIMEQRRKIINDILR